MQQAPFQPALANLQIAQPATPVGIGTSAPTVKRAGQLAGSIQGRPPTPEEALEGLPAGYEVTENPRTGLPFCRKQR